MGARWKQWTSWAAELALRGVDVSTLSLEEVRRFRVFVAVTAATITIGIPFIIQYLVLGVPTMSVAVTATVVAGIANLQWVRRTHNVRVGGIIGTSLVLVLLLLSNWFSGGFYDPNFAWFYVLPIYASLMVSARVGWIFTMVIALIALLFWLAPAAGFEISNQVPADLHAQQSLFNRLSAIIAIGIILGVLGNSEAFSHHLLLTANQDLQEQMRRKEEMAEMVVRSERLASMGTMAAGVGHEINNPLTYIIANLESLRYDIAAGRHDSDDFLLRLEDSIEGANRISVLVRDLKTFARIQDSKAGGVQVSKCIERAVQLTKHFIRQKATLKLNIDPELIAYATAPRLEQVLINLITNAADAISSGDASRHIVQIETALVGESVTIEVSDTGSGIPLDLKKMIFEPYFTTKASEQGTGMGLSISRNLTEAFGGRLELVSTNATGTCFRITLDCAKLDTHVEPPKSRVSETINTDTKILIVDDEKALLRSLKRALRGYSITTIADAVEALEVCKNGHFDLIICDLMMPDCDGMAFYEMLRATGDQTRVVFMSGGAYEKHLEEFQSRPEIEVLSKPVQIEKLRACIGDSTANQ